MSKKKLTIKPSYWLIQYQYLKSPKQYSYMNFGFDILDVIMKHNNNLNYDGTQICSVTRIIDEKEY